MKMKSRIIIRVHQQFQLPRNHLVKIYLGLQGPPLFTMSPNLLLIVSHCSTNFSVSVFSKGGIIPMAEIVVC